MGSQGAPWSNSGEQWPILSEVTQLNPSRQSAVTRQGSDISLGGPQDLGSSPKGALQIRPSPQSSLPLHGGQTQIGHSGWSFKTCPGSQSWSEAGRKVPPEAGPQPPGLAPQVPTTTDTTVNNHPSLDIVALLVAHIG
jgi:hypothetical protein